MIPEVAIVGAAAVSAFGRGGRGRGEALANGSSAPRPARELEATHPGTLAAEVPPIAPADDAGDARQRKLMARPARLAAIAARRALAEAGFDGPRAEVGFYLGVGASAPAMDEVGALLADSVDASGFSLRRCGEEGLGACNPLFTFQLLNNFSLCHAAILEGTGGANAALYSRGGGTVRALIEAAHAIGEGEHERALAGGADSALHPLTWSELLRGGYPARGLVPGEGAGLLALAARSEAPLALLEGATVARARDDFAPAFARALEAARGPIDVVVLAAWGDASRAALGELAAARLPGVRIVDASAGLGEALAATPALAWAAALDLCTGPGADRVRGRSRPSADRVGGEAIRALVLSAGIDGDLGAVAIRSDARGQRRRSAPPAPVAGASR